MTADAAKFRRFRGARRYSAPNETFSVDIRDQFQRDRDRLLYSAAFRRLALITQVVGPQEGYAFHNRLTHVLKVAQVGRRLAEKIVASTDEAILDKLGGLNPDVVESAGLAHDLGHPPFGHIAEKELDRLARDAGLRDGFEGNAQSFRIITKLEVRDVASGRPGLNLTRATLNAILKYPWFRGANGKRSQSWGAYASESADFRFARSGCIGSSNQGLEASLMDWADDIAYSIHDMDDFYRAGQIPLDRLSSDSGRSDDQKDFLLSVFARKEIHSARDKAAYETVASNLFALFPTDPYRATREQKAHLRAMTSHEIAKFEDATTVTYRGLQVDEVARIEVDLLKQLVWHYVIENPALATLQCGQRKIVRDLFEIYCCAFEKQKLDIFPVLSREEIRKTEQPIRVIVDLIANFTEQQAFEMHQRLTGAVAGFAFTK